MSANIYFKKLTKIKNKNLFLKEEYEKRVTGKNNMYLFPEQIGPKTKFQQIVV